MLPAVASKTHRPAGPAVAGDGQQSVVTRRCRVNYRPSTRIPLRALLRLLRIGLRITVDQQLAQPVVVALPERVEEQPRMCSWRQLG